MSRQSKFFQPERHEGVTRRWNEQSTQIASRPAVPQRTSPGVGGRPPLAGRRRAATPRRTSCACAAPSRSSTRSPERGAERLWDLLHNEDYVNALGALTGGQAVQMVRAGLKAIYLSGWQVAADANLAGQTYPDQSLYPANSVPGGGAPDQQRAAARRPDRAPPTGEADRDWLAPDRGRRRGRLRRPAERVRADEGDDRGRRGGRALGGPARRREEVRPPGRQGADPDGPAHPHAERGPAGRRRLRRRRRLVIARTDALGRRRC